MNFYYGLSAAIIGSGIIAVVQPQLAVALTPPEISAIAKEFTVQITGDSIGTGVIFERKGDTYFVVTNRHVIQERYEVIIQTADGEKHKVYYSQELPGLDLTILQFTSNKNYRVAELGNSDQIREGMTVYVAGWPDRLPGIDERRYDFTPPGTIRSILQNPRDGYALVYSNEATPGMSGGPVLDENARVVGINGRAIHEGNTTTAFRMGIPIRTFLAARNNGQQLTGNSQMVAREQGAEDFISLGGSKANRGDYQGAIAEYNRALRINPNNPDALLRRGSAYYQIDDYQAAIKDFNEVIRLSPNNADVYFYRGYSRNELGDKQGALSDYNQAIRLNPNFAASYNNRGNVRSNLGDKQGALADYNQAIRLNPNDAGVYYNRGNTRDNLGDYQLAIEDLNQAIRIVPNYARAYNLRGWIRSNRLKEYSAAITDFDQAIRLDPNLAVAYYNRGDARRSLGDKQRALADYQKAAELSQQQENRELYQLLLEKIRELQQ